jgi:tetraacyldisaccharide 4'-kinase
MNRLAAFHRRLCLEGPRHVGEGLLQTLLMPLGWLYGLIGLVRARFYAWGFLRSYRAPVPVISVGNLSAGGTGKTPVVDYLLRRLLAQGLRVAVVSRGYGGKARQGVHVVSSGQGPLINPSVCGDEPYLLARRNPDALVVVAPKRALGVRLAVEELGAQIVILDDGFQHLAVQRDLNLVLLDARHPLGNGHPLPAGLLREFPSALSRGDLFILTRWHEDCPQPPSLPRPVLHSRHVLSDEARDLEGRQVALTELHGKKAVAFAGIAAPESFFDDLREKGLNLIETFAFADHAVYDDALLQRLKKAAAQADIFVTTEKDGVKLSATQMPKPCWQVPMTLELEEGPVLDDALKSLTDRTLSHSSPRS